MAQLVIACARPGLIRGGVRHPKIAVHLLTAFTPDQLREMLAEPELALVIGRPLAAADVARLEAGEAIHAHEPPAPGPTGVALAAFHAGRTPAFTDAPPVEAVPQAGAAADTAAPATGKRGKGRGK